MKLSALYVVHNEEQFIRGSVDFVLPYVDELIFVDMSSTDKTLEMLPKDDKIKIFNYPYSEPIDMGAARTFSLSKCTGDWFLQVDADEYYPKESMEKIREFIETTDAISARVPYHNLAWRHGYKQILEHYPDRLYRTDVVEKYEGLLPNDMTIVKEEFRLCKFKGKGQEGVLEYDNPEDKSFIHPRQPIIDAPFYHLARTRGFNYEYTKWKKYNKNLGACDDNSLDQHTRKNQWVNGLYPMEKIEIPDYIPTNNIKDPKVSIIIPCYNKAQWIGEAIESCLNQTVKPYEIIVIDDGSTDNSAEIVGKFDSLIYIGGKVGKPTATVTHVVCYRQQNQGVAVARNNGLNKATGDYFILLDGDDKLAPTYIERCLQEMKGDIQVVYTDFQGMGEWDWRHRYSGNMDDLKTNQCIPSTMALCDMRILDPYGNFKPDAHYEDYEFWLNVYFNRKMNFKHIPEPSCYYRRTTGSRVDYLDQKKQEGYDQIRQWYGQFGVNPR